ncbi:MAG: hypothetical protein RR368_03170, partial [Oscillospiraceae bacterium]
RQGAVQQATGQTQAAGGAGQMQRQQPFAPQQSAGQRPDFGKTPAQRTEGALKTAPTPAQASTMSDSPSKSRLEKLKGLFDDAKKADEFKIGSPNAVKQKDAQTAKPSKTSSDEELPEDFKQRFKSASEQQSRSLRSVLHETGQFDKIKEINKSMLAPTIERGIDELQDMTMDRVVQECEPPEDGVSHSPIFPEKHPIFSKSITCETDVRGSVGSEADSSETKPKNLSSISFDSGTGEIILDEDGKQIEKKGVLNVKENVDDNFREFFGNTVIIDRESLDDKSKRRRKIKNFAAKDPDNVVGSPVFEDERTMEIDRLEEYRSKEDTEPVLAELMALRAKAMLRTTVTGILAIILTAISLMTKFELLPDALTTPPVYYIVFAAIMLAVIACNYDTVLFGFGKLVSFRANEDSLTSFAALIGFIQPAVMAFIGTNDLMSEAICTPVAALAVFASCFGKTVFSKRVLENFNNITDSNDKYASTILEDANFSRRLTRGTEVGGDGRILLRRKTGFTDNFLAHSFSKDNESSRIFLLSSIMFIVTLLCGVIAYLKTADFSVVLASIGLCAALCAPFTATLKSEIPLDKMQKHLSRYGTVVPGYSATDEVCATGCVVIEGRELFPKGNVMLHGIKTFERERIDKAILYAASVLINSCDTMANMFLSVIQNKTDMLYSVDGVVYEDGLGFSFWVDKERVMVGTRELLESHEIEVPSRDYENRYTKTSTRDAVYLAVSGKLYAMFVISYIPNTAVESSLHQLEGEGIGILVRTRDFFLTPERISKMYNIPRTMISIVSENDLVELSHHTEYAGHAASSLTHIGTLTSFTKGIVACFCVNTAVRAATVLELCCLLLGGLLGVTLTLFGALVSVGTVPIILFQTVWCLLMYVVVTMRKY